MLLILAGLPASGKTTVADLLRTKGWTILRTVTTRTPRAGEGTDQYRFVSDEAFTQMAADDTARPLLWAIKLGDVRYGMLKSDVTDARRAERVVTIITPNYARTLERAYGGPTVKVFLNPPKDLLEERLRQRNVADPVFGFDPAVALASVWHWRTDATANNFSFVDVRATDSAATVLTAVLKEVRRYQH